MATRDKRALSPSADDGKKSKKVKKDDVAVIQNASPSVIKYNATAMPRSVQKDRALKTACASLAVSSSSHPLYGMYFIEAYNSCDNGKKDVDKLNTVYALVSQKAEEMGFDANYINTAVCNVRTAWLKYQGESISLQIRGPTELMAFFEAITTHVQSLPSAELEDSAEVYSMCRKISRRIQRTQIKSEPDVEVEDANEGPVKPPHTQPLIDTDTPQEVTKLATKVPVVKKPSTDQEKFQHAETCYEAFVNKNKLGNLNVSKGIYYRSPQALPELSQSLPCVCHEAHEGRSKSLWREAHSLSLLQEGY